MPSAARKAARMPTMATNAQPIRRSTRIASNSANKPSTPSSSLANASIADTTISTDAGADSTIDDSFGGPSTPLASRSREATPEASLPGSSAVGPSTAASNVVVCVRVRPAAAQNLASPEDRPWSLTPETRSIEATEYHPSIAKRAPSSAPPGGGNIPSSPSASFLADSTSLNAGPSDSYKFTFDSLIPPEVTSLDDLYLSSISPVIAGAVEGFNGTVFAYGQTGSGKTYTMSGGGSEQGIIARAIDEVFSRVGASADREFLLRVSYLEIYNESLKDLLVSLPSSGAMGAAIAADRPVSPTKGGYSHAAGGSSASSASLRIMEHPTTGRITIAGLREEIVTQPSQVLDLLAKGQAARHQAATDWNERSSRSHCVATLTIESRERQTKGGGVRISALNLIDLAGSERAATEKERRKEGAFINKSLLTLGSVIAKLSNPSASAGHIPYRDSKLTRLLQTSLSGNARVAVLLTLSPLTQHAMEGLSTLNFGKRLKMIKLKAKRGEVGEGDGANDALLRKYKDEVERLRAKLEAGANRGGGGADDVGLLAIQQRRKAAESEVEDMTKRKAELRAQMEHLTRLILTSNSVSRSQDDTDSLLKAGPSTPLRRGRVSEFGTPGTPKLPVSRPASPVKRNGSNEEAAPRPFAMEVEMATLRKKLAAALDAKTKSESARAEERNAWSRRVDELEDALDRLQQEAETSESNLAEVQNLAEKLQGDLQTAEDERRKASDFSSQEHRLLKADITRLSGELEAERKKLATAEETLKKRPETEEESTQREFDELVEPARKAEEAKMGKSPLLGGGEFKQAGPSKEELLTQRETALEGREEQLAQREAELANKQAAPRPLPTPCNHGAEIESLNKALNEQQTKTRGIEKMLDEERANSKAARDATASTNNSSPARKGSSNLLAKPTTPLNRGGSMREYRRYDENSTSPTTGFSRAESSSNLGALSLADSPTKSAAIDAAVKAERDEIARLNEVINSQRALMADLEKSVSGWKERMRSQQEIIKKLMESNDDEVEQMPAPPAARAVREKPSVGALAMGLGAPSTRQPLKSNVRVSNGANDDFIKRRSAFEGGKASPVISNAAFVAKARPGSAFPGAVLSTAQGINRAPEGGFNGGLGLSAPNSPTKGSGLWTHQSPAGPLAATLLNVGADSPSRRGIHAHRSTIDNELEKLKGTPVKIDERTRELLDSPTRKSTARWGAAQTAAMEIAAGEKGSSKDWYI